MIASCNPRATPRAHLECGCGVGSPTRLISALREACPQATAGTARRFLIARDWSLDKATKMLGKH